jgi:hypothetical protein
MRARPLLEDGVQSRGVEATPLSEFVDRYSFGCGKALDKALDAWNIVVFDDLAH